MQKTSKETPRSPEKQKDVSAPAPASTAEMISKEPTPLLIKIKVALGADLVRLLKIEDENSYITLKPSSFLGTENFAKISSIVREFDGEYVSNGKLSHFRIYKGQGRKLAPPSAAPEPTRMPSLDPDELAKLPWQHYQDKKPAAPVEAGWIFANTKGAEVLVQLLRDQGGKEIPVTIGEVIFLISFSGPENKFISRTPQKK
jgi:hypothetical protein